jgi:hypothetical protein
MHRGLPAVSKGSRPFTNFSLNKIQKGTPAEKFLEQEVPSFLCSTRKHNKSIYFIIFDNTEKFPKQESIHRNNNI